MGKFISITALIILYHTIAIAQMPPASFSENVKKADSFLAVKQYKNAAEFYNKAFRNKEGYSIDYYHLFSAFCWDKAGYPDSALRQLYRLVYAHNFADSASFLSFFKSSGIERQPTFIKLVDRCVKNKKVKELPYDSTLARILDSVYLVDQSSRSLSGVDMKNSGVIISSDSQSRNLKLIDSIYAQYGWLAYSLVGHKGAMAQFLVIQHSDLQTQKKWLTRVTKAVNECLLEPDNLALLTDRILVQSGKKQLYGSQLRVDPKKKKYVPFDIESPSLVDSRRAKLGMLSLEEYLNSYNF